MREIILGKDHDLTIDGDHIARYKSGSITDFARKVAQAAECMLKTEEGEAFADRRHGCPWFNTILGLPAVHMDVAKKIIKTKLAAIDGVKKVQRVVLNIEGRNLSGSFTLVCTDGGIATGEF